MTGMDAEIASEWVLVISGLIAHADGVLESAECERLLSMLDEEGVDAETYSSWVSNIGDRSFLEERFEALPRPDGDLVPVLLREAWHMAMADGTRATEEEEALVAVAARLGVDAAALAKHRDAWAADELSFAEVVATAALGVAGDGQPLPEDARPWFKAFIEALPTEGDHREELLAMAVVPTSMAEGTRAFEGLERRSAIRCLRLVSKVVATHPRPDLARARFERLVQGASLSERLSEQIMDLSYA